MVVVAASPDGDSCQGFDGEVAGDQSVEVTATLLKAHSCGWIGFLREDDDYGYNLFLGDHRVTLSRDTPDDRSALGSAYTDRLTVGTSHKAELTIRNQIATVYLDGEKLFARPIDDGRPDDGTVQLGVEPDDGRMLNSSVAFQDVKILKL